MGTYTEVEGDLIKLAIAGQFDVICHGVNCFCTQGAGLAPQMVKAFGTDNFPMERRTYSTCDEEGVEIKYPTNNEGNINKLGTIDYRTIVWSDKLGHRIGGYSIPKPDYLREFVVVNCYTQYGPGFSHREGSIPLSYTALSMCLQKINVMFKGKHLGLPEIGCGLAGGDWAYVKKQIHQTLTDVDVTIVHFKPEENVSTYNTKETKDSN